MRNRLLIFSALGWVLASVSVPAAPPWESYPYLPSIEIDSSHALVVSVSGTVTADTTAGKQQTLAPGSDPNAALSGAGATLRTGPDGAATLVIPTAGIARVGPNTEIRLPSLPAGEVVVPAAPPGTEQPIPAKTTTSTQPASQPYDSPSQSGKQHLEVIKGDLFLKIDPEAVKKRGPTTFILKTPCSLLAVKGTEFFVSTDGSTDTTGVHDGSIQVYEPASDKSVILTKGSALSIKPGEIGSARRLTAEERRLEANYNATKIKRVVLEARWDTALTPEDRNAGSAATATNFSVKNPHGTAHTLILKPPLPGQPRSSVRDLLVDNRQVQGRPLALEFLVKGGHEIADDPRRDLLFMPSFAHGLSVACGLSYAPKAELHQAAPHPIPLQGQYKITRSTNQYSCRYIQLYSNPQFSLDGAPTGGIARLRFSVTGATDYPAEQAKVRAAVQGLQPPLQSITQMGGSNQGNIGNGIEITGVCMLVIVE